MKFISTMIPDVKIIEPSVFSDERGFFMESYRADMFSSVGIPHRFVQDNHSGSHKHVLRGLHYQISKPQGKLVRAITGTIFDVAVDLRSHSADYGRWVGEILSADNRKMFWIPPGFAHGFFVLSEWADVLYKATEYYAPECERTLLWNDERLGILWPIPPDVIPKISQKDALGLPLSEAEKYE